jgi:hypothetical protein
LPTLGDGALDRSDQRRLRLMTKRVGSGTIVLKLKGAMPWFKLSLRDEAVSLAG